MPAAGKRRRHTPSSSDSGTGRRATLPPHLGTPPECNSGVLGYAPFCFWRAARAALSPAKASGSSSMAMHGVRTQQPMHQVGSTHVSAAACHVAGAMSRSEDDSPVASSMALASPGNSASKAVPALAFFNSPTPRRRLGAAALLPPAVAAAEQPQTPHANVPHSQLQHEASKMAPGQAKLHLPLANVPAASSNTQEAIAAPAQPQTSPAEPPEGGGAARGEHGVLPPASCLRGRDRLQAASSGRASRFASFAATAAPPQHRTLRKESSCQACDAQALAERSAPLQAWVQPEEQHHAHRDNGVPLATCSSPAPAAPIGTSAQTRARIAGPSEAAQAGVTGSAGRYAPRPQHVVDGHSGGKHGSVQRAPGTAPPSGDSEHTAGHAALAHAHCAQANATSSEGSGTARTAVLDSSVAAPQPSACTLLSSLSPAETQPGNHTARSGSTDARAQGQAPQYEWQRLAGDGFDAAAAWQPGTSPSDCSVRQSGALVSSLQAATCCTRN